MKPQSLAMLIVAMGAGVAAMVGTRQYLDKSNEKKPEDTIVIYVAGQAIARGSSVNETMVKTMDYPKALAPKDAITDLAVIQGRVLKGDLELDEIVRESKFALQGMKSLEAMLGKDMRAITIPITASGAVAGLISPGSRVDIICTFPQVGNKPSKTVTLLQWVKVLAVNAEIRNNEAETRGKAVDMVTFELTPEQTETISQAKSYALSLSLRNPNESQEVATRGITADELMRKRSELGAPNEENDTMIADRTKGQEKDTGVISKLSSFFEPLAAKAQEKDKTAQKTEDAKPTQNKSIEPPVAVVATKAESEVSAKKQKKLVYRDVRGNPLWDVVVDADSPIAETLKEYLEELDSTEAKEVSKN